MREIASTEQLHRMEALYVLRGLPLDTLGERYNLSERELGYVSQENGWDAKRIAHLTETSIATDIRAKAISIEPDPLARHALVADLIVQQTQELALAVAAVEFSDSGTLKLLRFRAEALRTIAETAERAVKLSREARGVMAGAASAQERDTVRGVEYQVVMAA